MRRNYEKLTLFSLGIKAEGPVLDGSVTEKPLTVNRVTVEDYDNGFGSGTNNFEEITFD